MPRKRLCPAYVVVIDGFPIAFGNIMEESEPVNTVLDYLACVVSFNIINIPENPIVLGLPWFKLAMGILRSLGCLFDHLFGRSTGLFEDPRRA